MISVIIPVYNSEKSLELLCIEIIEVLKKLSEKFEIILIDDFSSDNSWNIIEKIIKSYKNIRGIKLSKNFGQHNALLCGIVKSKGEIIVTLDDDLQHDPRQMYKLLNKLDKKNDVVYGNSNTKEQNFIRNLVTSISKFFIKNIVGIKIVDKISPYRAFKSEIKHIFENYTESFVNIDVLLSWATSKIASVKIENKKRKYGKSNYNNSILANYTLNLIISFSTRPLRYSSILGFIIALFGFLIFCYVIFIWILYGSVVKGFPFLASIICIFSGTQLIVLGIIGEYIAKIHNNNMKKNSYLIDEEI